MQYSPSSQVKKKKKGLKVLSLSKMLKNSNWFLLMLFIILGLQNSMNLGLHIPQNTVKS